MKPPPLPLKITPPLPIIIILIILLLILLLASAAMTSAEQTVTWLIALGVLESPKKTVADPEAFLQSSLKDGVVLCRLLERLLPGSIDKVSGCPAWRGRAGGAAPPLCGLRHRPRGAELPRGGTRLVREPPSPSPPSPHTPAVPNRNNDPLV